MRNRRKILFLLTGVLLCGGCGNGTKQQEPWKAAEAGALRVPESLGIFQASARKALATDDPYSMKWLCFEDGRMVEGYDLVLEDEIAPRDFLCRHPGAERKAYYRPKRAAAKIGGRTIFCSSLF